METLSDADVASLEAVAREIRLRVLDMFVKSGKGHYGGCFSVTDILAWKGIPTTTAMCWPVRCSRRPRPSWRGNRNEPTWQPGDWLRTRG